MMEIGAQATNLATRVIKICKTVLMKCLKKDLDAKFGYILILTTLTCHNRLMVLSKFRNKIWLSATNGKNDGSIGISVPLFFTRK